MKIYLETEVKGTPAEVFKGFNETLFLKLAPPFPPFKLERFDGCKTGDEVHLKLWAGYKWENWISIITDDGTSEEEIFFVDEGTKLPPFLSFWKHQHRMKKSANGTTIIDDIEFQSPAKILDYLLYPVMYAQFAYRGPVYRKVFG